MSVINVTATRWKNYWELHIDGFGVTQSRTLAGAEGMVRDYITDDVDNVASVEIRIKCQVPGAEDAAEVRAELAETTAALHRAAARSRRIAHALKNQGISGTDTAFVLGVSPQRVSQLLKT